MRSFRILVLAALLKTLKGVFANRLQQAEPRFSGAIFALLYQTLVDERRHQFKKIGTQIAPCVTYRFGSLKGAAAPEDTESSKQLLLWIAQQAIAPIYGVAQRLLPLRRSRAPVVSNCSRLSKRASIWAGGSIFGARRCKLDCQWETVHSGADLSHNADVIVGQPEGRFHSRNALRKQ